jgi:hypothetical protein
MVEADFGHAAAEEPIEGARPGPASGRIWPVAATGFSTGRIAPIRHDLGRHPLMQLPALAELAKELLPIEGCRFVTTMPSADSRFTHQGEPPAGQSLEQVFAAIEQPGSWIALYNIERIERYKSMLEDALASARELVEREEPGIFKVTGFVFISAPPSVTPFHIDRENNFWLMVHGRKTLGLWDHRDRATVSALAVEDFMVHRDLSSVQLTDASHVRVQAFDCGPGEGVYFPATTPHMTQSSADWVRPGDGVAISIGITFYTSVTRRHALVHQANRLLRRLGVSPSEPGVSGWRDRLKQPLGWLALGWLCWRRPGYVLPPGVLRTPGQT